MCCDEILILTQYVYFSKCLEPPSVYALRLAGSVSMHSSSVLRESEISRLEGCPQEIGCIRFFASCVVRQRALLGGFNPTE